MFSGCEQGYGGEAHAREAGGRVQGPDAPQVTRPPYSVWVYPYLFHLGGGGHAARGCSLGANRGRRLSSA